MDNKAEIVAALQAPTTIAEAEVALGVWLQARGPQPPRCGTCLGSTFWTTPWGEELCGTCHPDPRALPGPEPPTT